MPKSHHTRKGVTRTHRIHNAGRVSRSRVRRHGGKK